jgi:hypothetical protein
MTCHNPYGFSYPLVNALSPEGTANDHWYVLNALLKREYLEPVEASNEIQVCSQCEGGLLNFKNCCPNCESVDLHMEPFVHCFSCGNVGPVKELMSHQELVCNRCQTTLKHIGIDYDKPLEDKICEKCQHRFFEPNTLSVQERIKQFDEKASPDDPKLDIKFGFLSSAEILENELDKDLLINEMLNRVNL